MNKNKFSLFYLVLFIGFFLFNQCFLGAGPTLAYVKTNSTGQIVGKWTERAFGQRLPIQEFATPYGFTGREFEESLGLSFHRARFYDPEIGRFISMDPVFGDISNPITQHPYVYGNLNPYLYTDPDGRLAFGLIDAGEDEAAWAARHYSAEYARSGGVGNLLMGIATSAWSDDTASTLSATTLISGGVVIGYVGGVVALEEAKTLVLTAGTTALSVVEKLKGWWNRGKASVESGTRLWPSASDGRITLNGIEYTKHALERMSPNGIIQKGTEIISRGIPPSVVENAIKYGTKIDGNTVNEVVHIFENVRVVTNLEMTRIITVIAIGH